MALRCNRIVISSNKFLETERHLNWLYAGSGVVHLASLGHEYVRAREVSMAAANIKGPLFN